MKSVLRWSWCVLVLPLLVGCPQAPPSEDGAQSAAVSGEMGDPRWREKILQNGLISLQTLADTEMPDVCRNQLAQTVGRLSMWLKEEPTPKGWQADPAAKKELAALDLLEEVHRSVKTLRINAQAHLAKDAAADMAAVSAALQKASAAISSDFPPMWLALRSFLQLSDTRVRQAGEWTPEFRQYMAAMEMILDRLSRLYGSADKSFVPGRETEGDDQHPLRFAFVGDAETLFEAFLLRDVSQWAQGKPSAKPQTMDLETAGVNDTSGVPNEVAVSAEDTQRAAAIFDWVVANVVLVDGDFRETFRTLQTLTKFDCDPQTPRETLLRGMGTVVDRAWVALLLARQQGLDMAILEVPAKREDGTAASRTLLAYVTKEDMTLFDPQLGVALPCSWKELGTAPEKYVELMKKGGISRVLTAEDVQKAQAFVEASPAALSLRMRLLQTRLTGRNRVVLTAEPSAQIQRLKELGVSSVELWSYPCEIAIWRALNLEQTNALERRLNAAFALPIQNAFPYWRARLLHLKGVLTGPLSATFFYQKSRMSDTALHDLALSDNNPGEYVLAFLKQIRLAASYFMGNLSYSVGNDTAAHEYYDVHVLKAAGAMPNPWADDARCHCGRIAERAGDNAAAAEFYRAVTGPEKPQAAVRMETSSNEK